MSCPYLVSCHIDVNGKYDINFKEPAIGFFNRGYNLRLQSAVVGLPMGILYEYRRCTGIRHKIDYCFLIPC